MAAGNNLGEHSRGGFCEAKVAAIASRASVGPDMDCSKRGGAEHTGARPGVKDVAPPGEFRTNWVGEALAAQASTAGGVVEAPQEGFATRKDLRHELEQAGDALHVQEVG